MRELEPPFRFDLGALISRARRVFGKRVEGVAISLPFVTFNVRPHDIERKVAREIVIRMADRRVLNAFECCDSCIREALASLHEIRSLLVDKQVELAELSDGPLYLLIECQLEAIRQFLTFEQRLRGNGEAFPDHVGPGNLPWLFHERDKYFAALEMLRAHLHRCLSQVAAVADMEIPRIPPQMRYDGAWQVEAYVKPALKS